MREILKENKYLILLWILCILGLSVFLGHYAEILIDFGREVYYPQRILQGDVLYKDLFNIYGPLAYQINAVLYKIFGAKLSTLYGAGIVCSILTVSGIYLLASRFLSKFLSFSIGLFTIAVGITTTSIFNFHFPYSWAVLYGLIAFIYSLYFLVDKKNLPLSAFLAGVCVTCKYDFLLYGFIVLFLIIKSKDWKAFLSFISVPVISFGVLFAQGLNFSDILNSLIIIKTMAKTKTLTYFYQNSGIYFHPKALITDLILFIKFAIPFGGILLGVWKNKKVITIIFFILFVLMFNIKYQVMFGFLPMLLAILTCIKIGLQRSLSLTNVMILIISVLAVSVKVFWLLILQSYGTYYAPILIIAALTLLPEKFWKVSGIYLIILSCLIAFVNNSGHYVKFPYKVIEYIKENTKPTDKIVIYPEGMMINFLANRQSDGFYNSMLPLYTEALKEENFVSHFKENPPEYVIFNNLYMGDYYFKYICEDYAYEFCAFVKENYNLINVIEDTHRYSIFMLK